MLLQYLRCCIWVVLLVGCSINYITAQSYLYANKELLYDNTKEYVKLMTTSDGSIHVWMWGNGRTTLDIFNAKLQFQERKTFRKLANTLLFYSFNQFYYVLMIEEKTSRLYRLDGDNPTDRTADLNNIPLVQSPLRFIEQGGDKLYFIQFTHADTGLSNRINITTTDANLNYISSLQLGARFSPSELRRLKLFTMGNRLLMVNTRVFDSTMVLSVHQVDIPTSKVVSNSIQFNNEMLFPGQILPTQSGWIVESQASRSVNSIKRQSSYTHLLQLDSNLHLLQNFYTAAEDSSLKKDAFYYYLPVTTQLLPNGNFLIVDYERCFDKNSKKMDVQLRCFWLDSSFSIIRSIERPTVGYTNYPAFLFSRGAEVFAYYEEEIKSNIAVVHGWKLNGDADDDRILQLNPKNRYLLRKTVRISNDTFILPYQRNYKFGLVKVHVAPQNDL